MAPYSDHSSRKTNSSKKPHTGYVSMSTVEDLSYTPSVEEKTRDAAQIVATGRRSWKTLKGRGEAVWPPHLEAALIEALEKYRPDDSRSSKTLGRFSMRNRFISDYIFETAGKRRTPKQVGSRLQQLRDTCKSDKIMQLISRRNVENDGDSGGSTYSGSPSPAPEMRLSQGSFSDGKTVWVNIVLERLSWSSLPPVINIVNNEKVMPLVIHLAPTSGINPPLSCFDSMNTGLLSNLEPTVTFASPYSLERRCSFSVFADNTGLPIHTESAVLTEYPRTRSSGSLYGVSLVPSLWQSLCESTTPTRFTIVQTLYIASPIASSDSNDHAHISVVYNFTYPESSTELLPAVPAYMMSGFSFMNDQPLASIPERNWNTGVMNSGDIDWSSSFGSYSQLNTINSDLTPRYEIPTISRNGRGLTCPADSWVNGPKYAPQALSTSLSYC